MQRRREELEKLLVTGPAETWLEAAAKLRYLIELYAKTPSAQDPRRKKLIALAARRSQAVVCSKKGQFMKYFLGVDATNEQRPNDTPRSANASDAKPTFRARGPASVSACAVKIQPHGGPAY